ncbi:endonuclease NucS domain-containing protein [Streptomyces sp. NPDC004533]|uniref:endonuclease NucS domain-containing protein n=1 Tax=Streptomyces sp. NPDC004533 TaxID=3154278 RepID=UPI0033A4E777
MPLEFGLWRVDDKPVRVATRVMPLESRLEELIEADPGILGHPLLLIGRQVLTQYGKVVDLLGMDAEGGLHVLELKRDRTPREVVAQVLDYGSWVQELTNEQIREIYASYARGRGLAEELDEAFAVRFGGTPPEALNSTHALTIVASEIDAATERIVTYLASGFQVPVNVLFFRYFEDDGRSYLARTWLMDEAEAVLRQPERRAVASRSRGTGRIGTCRSATRPGAETGTTPFATDSCLQAAGSGSPGRSDLCPWERGSSRISPRWATWASVRSPANRNRSKTQP